MRGGGKTRGVLEGGIRPLRDEAEDDVDRIDSAALAFTRGTVTQSGSSVGIQGLEGLEGFGMASLLGGRIVDLAGRPFSNHHLLRSELAGGRPGSMESYPISSSSSVSSLRELATVPPTSAFRFSKIRRLRSSRIFSSIILTVHWKTP